MTCTGRHVPGHEKASNGVWPCVHLQMAGYSVLRAVSLVISAVFMRMDVLMDMVHTQEGDFDCGMNVVVS